MEVADLRELLTPAGLRLLDEVSESGHHRNLLGEITRLRKAGVTPGLVSTVITQVRLRAKARSKFGEFADRMLFTQAGLEQATRLSVAAHHASRYARAEIHRVADLGCGIGGDALAFASLDLDVRAVECDEVTAAIASFNLAPFDNCRIEHSRVEDVNLEAEDSLWFDPARRTSGHTSTRKLANPDDWSPSLHWVFERAGEKPAGIKLGPGFPLDSIPRELGGETVEAQWVDVAGETVELVVWTKSLARAGIGRAALVLGGPGDEVGFHEMVASGETGDPPVGTLARFIYEPHGAVIRARLIGQLAHTLGAHTLDNRIAYLTSESYCESPFADVFEVHAVLPIDPRKISTELVARGIGSIEIKKRGVDIDPAAFRRTLKLQGPNSATLILTRTGQGSTSARQAILCRRRDGGA